MCWATKSNLYEGITDRDHVHKWPKAKIRNRVVACADQSTVKVHEPSMFSNKILGEYPAGRYQSIGKEITVKAAPMYL